MSESKGSSKYTNLEPNIAGALAYLITPFSGIALWLIEKDDKFVRFHAFQSILFGVISYIAWMIASSTVFIWLGFLLLPLATVGFFILFALLMWKAYNHEMYELPILGKIAKEQANK